MLIYPNTIPYGLKDLVLSAAIALPVPTPDRFLPKTLRLHTRMQTTPPEGLSQKGQFLATELHFDSPPASQSVGRLTD